jgi:hypothetical protein
MSLFKLAPDNGVRDFHLSLFVSFLLRLADVPNGRCSPRRGETATQRDRGRGGTRVLGTVSSLRQSFIDHLSPKQSR